MVGDVDTPTKDIMVSNDEDLKKLEDDYKGLIDLYKKDYSGLRKTRKKLSNIDEISVMEFQNSDIVRNPIVSKILEVFPEK